MEQTDQKLALSFIAFCYPVSRTLFRLRKKRLHKNQVTLSTAGSLFNLAGLHYNTQQPQQALTHIKQAIDIYLETLGPAHPNTQAAMSWLAPIQKAVESASQPR